MLSNERHFLSPHNVTVMTGGCVLEISQTFSCISLIFKSCISLSMKHVFLYSVVLFNFPVRNCGARGMYNAYISDIFICISLIYKSCISLVMKNVFLWSAFSNCDDRRKWIGYISDIFIYVFL